MGWNKGYEIMEQTVISVYNTGNLTPDLLDSIMEPYKGTDCDSGGSRELKAKDGKAVEEIICSVMEPEKYREIVEEHMTEDDTFMDCCCKAYDIFESIWRERWGIW